MGRTATGRTGTSEHPPNRRLGRHDHRLGARARTRQRVRRHRLHRGPLIPASRAEDRTLGPVADDVKAKAKETGQEALERGQQVAQEAAQSARDTVQEKGREHGEELASSAQQNMQQATSNAG